MNFNDLEKKFSFFGNKPFYEPPHLFSNPNDSIFVYESHDDNPYKKSLNFLVKGAT